MIDQEGQAATCLLLSWIGLVLGLIGCLLSDTIPRGYSTAVEGVCDATDGKGLGWLEFISLGLSRQAPCRPLS